MTDETTPDFDDAMVRAQRAIGEMDAAHNRAVVDCQGAWMRVSIIRSELAAATAKATALEAERDALAAEVARLTALLAQPVPTPAEPFEDLEELPPVDPTPVPPVETPPSVPATPTGGVWPRIAPPNITGIDVVVRSGDARFVHLTQFADGSHVPGCKFVVFATDGTILDCVSSTLKGTIRRRVSTEWYGVNYGFSAQSSVSKTGSGYFKSDGTNGGFCQQAWPSSSVIARELVSNPLYNGLPCFPVTAAEDRTPVAIPETASGNGIRFLVVVVPPGTDIDAVCPQRPVGRAHSPFPLLYGDDVVTPIHWDEPVIRPRDLLAGLNVHPELVSRVNALNRNAFQTRRGNKYDVPTYGPGVYLDMIRTTAQGRSWSLLSTALDIVGVTDIDFVKRALLYGPLWPDRVALEEHGNYTELAWGKGYDDAEQVEALLHAYPHVYDDCDDVERRIIQDGFRTFMWGAIWQHRNPYAPWIDGAGNCCAMWETGRDGVASMVAIAFGDLGVGNRAWAHPDIKSFTGMNGLIDSNGIWRGGPIYANNGNCIGPYAVALAVHAHNGICFSPHVKDGLLALAKGQLHSLNKDGTTSPIPFRMWNPALCNANFPAYRDYCLATYGRQAILDAAVNTSSTGDPRSAKFDPSKPGGIGPGSHNLLARLVDV